MRDQLSLRLEPETPVLPNLPAALRPMLPRPIAEPFDSDAHLFEPSWGGLRALAFVGPADAPGAGDVVFVDGVGRSVPSLPELSGLAVRVDARSAVLDGELVVVGANGLADGDELARRLGGRPAAQGIAGVMARQGSSPYLPGVKSRLWRFIPTLAPGVVPLPAGEAGEAEVATAASAPVVALIRRLPLQCHARINPRKRHAVVRGTAAKRRVAET
jgi:ATP-dependent DNA ligase